MPEPGRFVVTIRVPGEKAKKRVFRTTKSMTGTLVTLPAGTKIWVMVEPLNLGYGLEVDANGSLW